MCLLAHSVPEDSLQHPVKGASVSHDQKLITPRERPPYTLMVKKRKPLFLSLHLLLLLYPKPGRGSFLVSTVPKWPPFFYFSLLPTASSLWPDGLTVTLPSLFSAGSASIKATGNHMVSQWTYCEVIPTTCSTAEIHPLLNWAQITDFTHFPDKYHCIRFVSVFAFELVCCSDGLSWSCLYLPSVSVCLLCSHPGRAGQSREEAIPSGSFFSIPPCGFQTFMFSPKSNPCGSADKDSHLQCRRPGFDPWIGKIPWRRERLFYSGILAWRIPWTI